MTKKKISEKSKSYIREISDQLKILETDQEDIDREIASGNKKLLEFFEGVQPWFGLYSFSHQMLAFLFYEFLGYGDEILKIAESENKREANMALFREMVSQSEGDTLYDELDNLEPYEQSAFMSINLAMQGNMEGLKRYNQTVSELVSRAKDDHDALFSAVAVDRSVVGNPVIAREISLANLRQDESFMNLLAKAITRTKPRRNPRLDDTRFMIEIIDEVEGLDQISNEQIAEFLQNDLAVYPSDGKDPESAIKKLLQRRMKRKGT